jgi:hypothetical protein
VELRSACGRSSLCFATSPVGPVKGRDFCRGLCHRRRRPSWSSSLSLRHRNRVLPGLLRAALHRRAQQAPHQTALDRRPGQLKDDPVKGPFPKAVCTVTIVVCNGAHGARNGACAVCTVPASAYNGTDSMDGVSYYVCSVTQALGRFACGHCGPANSVCGRANIVRALKFDRGNGMAVALAQNASM